MLSSERQCLQKSRDPNRLRSSQLIARLIPNLVAMDSPDPALIAGTGRLNGMQMMIFAQQKPRGRDDKLAADVNYGMMNANGYWYVLELLDRISSSDQPVLFLVDTPGADPSKLGSENLLAWAISSCARRLIRQQRRRIGDAGGRPPPHPA